MPDLSTPSSSLTPPPLPKQDALAPFSDADERTRRFEDQSGALVGQMERVGRDTRQRNDKLENALELQKPPQLQQVPYHPPHGTDPVEQWGSAAMIFATLGSLFTRRPMVTAMKAATAALNAFKAGDQQAAKTYYEQWKVANDNAMALAKYQQDAYQNVMRSYERREANNTAAGAAEERALQARMTALAAGFRDTNLLQIAQNRGIQGVNNEVDRRQKQMEDLQFRTAQMQARRESFELQQQVRQSPEFQEAARKGDALTMARLMAEGTGDPRAVLGYAQVQAKLAAQSAKASTKTAEVKAMAATAQDHITAALDLIPQIGRGAISQIIQKGEERIAGAVGYNMENPATMYDSYIDAIKLDILAQQHSAGTRNVEFRRALDALLPTITHWEGSTGQEIRLKILANVLARSQGQPDRFKDVSRQTPAVEPTPGYDQPEQPQGGEPGQIHASPASAGGRPPARLDTSRVPTEADKKSAFVARSPQEATSAPPGWITDGRGHYVYKSGGATEPSTPVAPPQAPAPPVPNWNPPAGMGYEAVPGMQ